MHYEDQDRRIHLASGLLFGTLLGTTLALLIGADRVFSLGRRQKASRGWRQTSRRLGAWGEDALEAATDVLAAGRKRLGK